MKKNELIKYLKHRIDMDVKILRYSINHIKSQKNLKDVRTLDILNSEALNIRETAGLIRKNLDILHTLEKLE